MQSEMALIAVLSYLLGSFLVYHVVAEKNHTAVAEVNIECKCKAVTGFKIVNIIWKPLDQKDSSILTNYRVLYDSDMTGQFQFGCTLNTTHHSQKKELQCSIIAKSFFLFQFHFIVEIRNSSGVFISTKKACRLSRTIQCTRPQNLTVIANGKRTLSVSWQPAPYMADQTPLLCYKIWYAAAQAKTNESMEISFGGELQLFQTISDLYPYTDYTFFIQCSLADCVKGWGLFGGPVTGRTDEEAPTEAPEFKNWSVSNTESDKRDVTVVWKLPPLNTWNGVLKKFSIDIWQVSSYENGSSIPIPNSLKNLQIDDGLATEATLRGLSRFMDYKTQISMCTAEGCGPTSVPLPFAGEKNLNKKTSYYPSVESNLHWIVIGIVAGLVGLFLVLIVAVAVYRHRKNSQQRRNQASLQQRLQLDPVYGNLEDSSSSRRHSYDEIQLHEPEENLRDVL